MGFVFRELTADEFRYWYNVLLPEAFPPQEIKPFEETKACLDAGRYEVWGLFTDKGGACETDRLLGYAALFVSPDYPLVLLDYLGVREDCRNAGLGSEILDQLKALGRPYLAEAELPVPLPWTPAADDTAGDAEAPNSDHVLTVMAENDLRRRRIGFYERNGLAPLYVSATCGVRMQVLYWGPDVPDPEDPGAEADILAIADMHKHLYPAYRDDVLCPLPEGVEPPLPHWME